MNIAGFMASTDPIPLQKVESSNIAAVGYDWPSATLAVHFRKHNLIYHYYPVPKPLFEGLRKARSPGGYHAKFIRNSPSIRGVLWCDCGVFVETGEHTAECRVHTFESHDQESHG